MQFDYGSWICIEYPYLSNTEYLPCFTLNLVIPVLNASSSSTILAVYLAGLICRNQDHLNFSCDWRRSGPRPWPQRFIDRAFTEDTNTKIAHWLSSRQLRRRHSALDRGLSAPKESAKTRCVSSNEKLPLIMRRWHRQHCGYYWQKCILFVFSILRILFVFIIFFFFK